MALETATYIDALVTTNPTGTDSRTTADDHIRLIKAALKRTFPNVSGAMTSTHTELNYVSDLTASAQSQLNTLSTGKLNLSATAVFAQSAGFASSATNATSAVRSNTAVHAISAVRANSAVFATSADRASSAINATQAANASSAAYAFSATRAASAARATSADRAFTATGYSGPVAASQIPNASTGGQGVIQLATTATYEAGTNASIALTPGVFGRPLSAGTSGYLTLGQITVQWGQSGTISNGSFATITMPTSFSAATYSAVATPLGAGVPGGADGWAVASLGTTSFRIYNDIGTSATFTWMAIGRT